MLRTVISRIGSDGILKTPGELPPTNTTTTTTVSCTKEGTKEKSKDSKPRVSKVCSTGTQSVNSVGADPNETTTFSLNEKKKKMQEVSKLMLSIATMGNSCCL